MSKKENYESRTQEILVPITEANQVEFYDVEYVKEGSDWILRCYIDKPEGVNINECEAVSRALSQQLDAEDFIEDAYILEVSSPGLGRALKKDKHLEKALGQEVELKTYKPVNGQKDFTGVLKAYDETTITIASALEDSNEEEPELVFLKKEIAIIKLALDF